MADGCWCRFLLSNGRRRIQVNATRLWQNKGANLRETMGEKESQDQRGRFLREYDLSKERWMKQSC